MHTHACMYAHARTHTHTHTHTHTLIHTCTHMHANIHIYIYYYYLYYYLYIYYIFIIIIIIIISKTIINTCLLYRGSASLSEIHTRLYLQVHNVKVTQLMIVPPPPTYLPPACTVTVHSNKTLKDISTCYLVTTNIRYASCSWGIPILVNGERTQTAEIEQRVNTTPHRQCLIMAPAVDINTDLYSERGLFTRQIDSRAGLNGVGPCWLVITKAFDVSPCWGRLLVPWPALIFCEQLDW